jgi:hypothetical protein
LRYLLVSIQNASHQIPPIAIFISHKHHTRPLTVIMNDLEIKVAVKHSFDTGGKKPYSSKNRPLPPQT